MATKTTRSAMPPSRRSGKFGTVRRIAIFARRCSLTGRRQPAPTVACVGACDQPRQMSYQQPISGVPIVSVIIPCLNEETAITGVVSTISRQGIAEVIVVDGGSLDQTAERAAAAGAKVIVEPRRGYGRAIQAGI